MSGRIRNHLRTNVVGYVALFFVLTGGTAYALDGSNTVFTDDIVNGEVKTADIDTGSVTNGKLGTDAVKSNKILDGSVKNADLEADSVDSSKVVDNSLGSADIGTNAVGDDEVAPLNGDANIVDETITTFDIQSNAIQTDEIQDATVGAADIGPSAVRASELGDGIVDHPDPTPTLVPGGAAENGSYAIATSTASCAAGEQLIAGYGQWEPNDNASNDYELFISEVRLNHAAETVTVDGGNDSGVDHSLVAVATCLAV